MARTSIISPQIRDGEVKRSNVNTTETGEALLRKIVSGDMISLSSTGVDAGTGDVTVGLDSTGATTGQVITFNGSTYEAADPVASDQPIGTIMPYAGSSAPFSYLLCDGSAVSRTTYSELFSIVGTSFGVGDGSTTFNLPDLRGRMPKGYSGSTPALGDVEENHLGNSFFTEGSTSDATQTTLCAFTIPDNITASFRVEVTARFDSTTTKSYWAKIDGAVLRNNAGSATLVGTPAVMDDSQGGATYSATVDVNVNDVRIRVTGAAAETVKWSAKVYLQADDEPATFTQSVGTSSSDATSVAVNFIIKYIVAAIPAQSYTADRVLVSDGSGAITTSAITTTQLNYLSTLSSDVQAQLDTKFDSSNLNYHTSLSGTQNGVNTVFTLSSTPVAGSEFIFMNGILLEPGGGNDYTISGDTVTFAVAPDASDKLRASYIA